MGHRCPVCRREVAAGSASFPFCGERCRLVDLGNWIDERYVIGGSEEEDAAPQDIRGGASAPDAGDERNGDPDPLN